MMSGQCYYSFLFIRQQDPVLFQGTVRFNLDPFQVYSDSDIHEALSSVHLSAKIHSLDRGLDSVVTQNGENFSVGERQLMCLARSMLRRYYSDTSLFIITYSHMK